MGQRLGRERMDTCISTAESLHCSPKTTTTLLTGYTPVQNKKFKVWKKYEEHHLGRAGEHRLHSQKASNRHQFSQFSHSVMSDSLQLHESKHARPPCASPSPGVHSNSHPSSRWCHPAISSSVVPFSSCPQSLPASESFPISQLFPWGGQSTGVSAQSCPTLCNPMDCTCQAPLSMEFSRQEYWSGLPFPSPIIWSSENSKTETKFHV